MKDIAFLLLTLFSITIAEPKPPEKISKIQRTHIVAQHEELKPLKKTIYNMSVEELNALSLSKKAKLVYMSKKSFKAMTKVINHEAGPKMEDKILVAAVIWNRRYCKQFGNSVYKVITERGQFYNIKGKYSGSSKDKKAQLAILLAYREIHRGKIPHDVMYFNSISYKTKNPKRFVRYKHVNNYFIRDSKCKCKWCRSN